MRTYTVNKYANSSLRGKRGRLVAISDGRAVWLRGLRFAKFLCLVFDDGIFAGRKLWFKTGEIDRRRDSSDQTE